MVYIAGPDGSFISAGACNLGVPGSNPGLDGYLSSWLCIYSAPNCSKAMYSAAYGTVHYKEPLQSFEIRVGHIDPASGFLLSRYFHDCAESDVKQYSFIFIVHIKIFQRC